MVLKLSIVMNPIVLIKASEPGWEKEFPTIEDARIELLKHICAACLAGELDEIGITTGITITDYPPNQNDIIDLLCTPCGCEFWLEADE